MPTEPENAQDPIRPATTGFGRRGALLAAGAVLAAGIGAAADELARGDRAANRTGSAGGPPPGPAIPFHGVRQAGVTAPQQPATQLLAFDLPQTSAAADRQTLRGVLDALGRTLAAVASDTPPDPRLQGGGTTRLTSLVGVGPALAARLGLDVPAALAELPAFPGDRLDPARGNGDLVLQLCAADRWTLTVVAELAGTAAHAAGAAPRWSQSGFLPRTAPGTTPRNLFGFKDGTANPDDAAAEQWVWGPPGAHRNGTVMVYRRIRMDVAGFAALPADRRDRVIGRRAGDGVPLTGTAEHDDPDIYAKNPDGSYVIPVDAHVRLTSPRLDGGARMLRRSYSYDDGPADRGLLFCAFMRDPAQFVRVQDRLASRDALTPFLQHQASAVCYVLPGAAAGGTLGEQLWT
ncbi:Dyp-type peroxidase [Kitasatospora sp. RB6PN24]|uniref:Dyp-type peroxidase n=1 Tax=Kitasatospora humi TaxID=2893891 RepID=UPI001E5812BE|nr:Dyp-type peroxidase [Kitasatospora humi]MCC9308078.1 Dyp-type peroxidase [Kitasatospora humi]